nr:TD and POZ domain-containing protein 3-like [Parasteatoda tepidariorum]
MSAESIVSTNLVAQHYRGEFKLSNLHTLKSHSLRTTPFCPMPNINLEFCFEISYMHYNINSDVTVRGDEFILLKLKLLTLCASDLPKTMKLKLNVDLIFIDRSLLHRYKLLPALTTDEMKSVVFDDVLTSYYTKRENMGKLVNKHSFIIQCEMEFFNHIHSPPSYYKELSFSNHLKHFAANFKSLQKFGELSDISINIGEKSLPVHKAVLAGHSPVFRNMLSHDFKESLTNTITIADSTYEVFECFLQYLYSGEIEDKSWPTARELYSLADKYDVLSLKQLTAEIISSQISLENVCDILNLAFDYDDDKIRREAVGFAAIHLRKLLPTKQWKELIAKHPLAGYEAAISYVL